MKKGFAILAGVLVLAGGAVYLSDGEIKELHASRVPLENCNFDNCPGGMAKLNDSCICYTDKEIPEEITADKIPADKRVRVILCCDQVDPETKQKRHIVTRIKGLQPLPVGCQVLKENIVIDATSPGGWLEFDEAMAAACCADCPESCFVRGGSHGQCPYCLCEGNCKDYCPKESP